MKAISGFYYVETADGLLECKAPGKFRREKITPVVGDVVQAEDLGGGKGVLRSVLPRRNSFARPAAVNIDQMVILAANVIPVTEPFLIDRVAAIAESQNCEPVICINKCDLDRGDTLFETYTKAGFTTIRLSAMTGEGAQELMDVLRGKVSVFTGNSGVGKSSVLNMLSPELNILTGEVSNKLGRGRHTTRHVELYRLPNGAAVMDTPGFSSFDADNTELRVPEKVQDCFREFAPYKDLCRFQGCAHIKEKGCRVLEALEAGEISPSRYKSYAALYEKAREIPFWEREK